MTDRQIAFSWGISSNSGWGVYGLNLALHAWAADRVAVSLVPSDPAHLGLDPARLWALRRFFKASRHLQDYLRQTDGPVAAPSFACLQGLGNKLASFGQTRLVGDRNIGVVFSEYHNLSPADRDSARRYQRIIAGSSWNARILRDQGVDHVLPVLQGIDPGLFHPAPRNGLFHGRFTVFSGGKLEGRKGQDIVLRTFRRFQRRHPEALLITAWQSPWARFLAQGMARTAADLAPPPVRDDETIDSVAWAMSNGIPGGAVLDLGSVPNALMPPLLREMDAALFPNRCEGGTNLVAMEAMACGVPTILSANTGHLDLIAGDNCFPLRHQPPVSPVFGDGLDGWGESDPEEADALLESIYTDRQDAARRAAAGAASLGKLTWSRQIAELLRAIAC